MTIATLFKHALECECENNNPTDVPSDDSELILERVVPPAVPEQEVRDVEEALVALEALNEFTESAHDYNSNPNVEEDNKVALEGLIGTVFKAIQKIIAHIRAMVTAAAKWLKNKVFGPSKRGFLDEYQREYRVLLEFIDSPTPGKVDIWQTIKHTIEADKLNHEFANYGSERVYMILTEDAEYEKTSAALVHTFMGVLKNGGLEKIKNAGSDIEVLVRNYLRAMFTSNAQDLEKATQRFIQDADKIKKVFQQNTSVLMDDVEAYKKCVNRHIERKPLSSNIHDVFKALNEITFFSGVSEDEINHLEKVGAATDAVMESLHEQFKQAERNAGDRVDNLTTFQKEAHELLGTVQEAYSIILEGTRTSLVHIASASSAIDVFFRYAEKSLRVYKTEDAHTGEEAALFKMALKLIVEKKSMLQTLTGGYHSGNVAAESEEQIQVDSDAEGDFYTERGTDLSEEVIPEQEGEEVTPAGDQAQQAPEGIEYDDEEPIAFQDASSGFIVNAEVAERGTKFVDVFGDIFARREEGGDAEGAADEAAVANAVAQEGFMDRAKDFMHHMVGENEDAWKLWFTTDKEYKDMIRKLKSQLSEAGEQPHDNASDIHFGIYARYLAVNGKPVASPAELAKELKRWSSVMKVTHEKYVPIMSQLYEHASTEILQKGTQDPIAALEGVKGLFEKFDVVAPFKPFLTTERNMTVKKEVTQVPGSPDFLGNYYIASVPMATKEYKGNYISPMKHLFTRAEDKEQRSLKFKAPNKNELKTLLDEVEEITEEVSFTQLDQKSRDFMDHLENFLVFHNRRYRDYDQKTKDAVNSIYGSMRSVFYNLDLTIDLRELARPTIVATLKLIKVGIRRLED